MAVLTQEEVQDLWARELESGKWEQGKAQLRRPGAGAATEAYCCLGVLTQLAVDHGVIETFDGEDIDLLLYPEVQEWAGLQKRAGRYELLSGKTSSLASDNDAGVPFLGIAAVIRRKPKGLFW